MLNSGWRGRIAFVAMLLVLVVGPWAWQVAAGKDRNAVWLPSSKRVLAPAPGVFTRTNGLPVTMAVSPDGRNVAVLFAGYGAESSQRQQSIGIFDRKTGKYSDFPDARLGERAHQAYFVGLAWSSDGTRVYASVVSMTDIAGDKKGHTGNGIAVYQFKDGGLTAERFLKLPQVALAEGKRGARGLYAREEDAGKTVPYPAAIAVIAAAASTAAGASVAAPDADKLLVAENLSDDVVVMDAATGAVEKRFDLSTNGMVPASFPYGVIATKNGQRAWVSLWNEAKLAELDLVAGKVSRWIALPAAARSSSSPHATAMALSADEGRLFVALANADSVAEVDTAKGVVVSQLWTKLPGQKAGGSGPLGVALSADGTRLFAADSGTNSVAMFNLTARDGKVSLLPVGFIPTEWYPTAVVVAENDLVVASGKGLGTGANKPVQDMKDIQAGRVRRSELPYIPTLIRGSLARLDVRELDAHLNEYSSEVREGNLLTRESEAMPAGAHHIKHVIYIIKENRTYDQVLGDLGIGDGDKSLTIYGEDVTPNQHKLARQFGVLDNFYDSGEVSADGHEWSTAAITSDYNEKTWPLGYRAGEHTYDYEGVVADEYPLHLKIADVDEPGTGYLWNNLATHKVSYRHYGEFVATEWCEARGRKVKRSTQPQEGTIEPPGSVCEKAFVKKGEALPARLGGGPSPYPWDIPLIRRNVATKAELEGHYDENFADFNTSYPDQLRTDEFLFEFQAWVKARDAGNKDDMPQFILLRLPNDHTGGTRANQPTPSASVADNDLAVGRVVEAISQSAYWDDTAIMVLEDDAQDGADHVDAHRSLALVVSKYAPLPLLGGSAGQMVDHNFYTTVSMIRTLETLLGLPPMNVNDAFAPLMARRFTGPGQQAPFKADRRNRDNGLIYEMNRKEAKGSAESEKMDFSHADAVDAQKLNAILWRDRKGDVPMPAPKHSVILNEREDGGQ